ncbi:MAG TPA: HAD hydrolase family protein [Kofleriaceae bacterium]
MQDRDATKSGAIAKLRRSLDRESRRLVVFGGGINDLDMFLHADHAVAVANAVPEILAVASEIAARNDQDGVVRWIVSDVRLTHDSLGQSD